MQSSNSRGRTYDLHIHLDTHTPHRYSASDYYVSLLELDVPVAGFVLHDAVPAREQLDGITTFFGIEHTIPGRVRRRKDADYSLAHVMAGHDLVEIIDDMARARIDILAHPFSTATWCSDWEYLLGMMAQRSIAIEYNASYGGPDWLYERACERGVQVTFGSDAHSPGQLSTDIPSFVTPISELPFTGNG
jgi:hypothetical protein